MIYKKIFITRWLNIKIFIFVLLVILFRDMKNIFFQFTDKKYDAHVVEYIIRLTSFSIIILTIYLIYKKYKYFIMNCYQSLILLGLSNCKILLILIIHNWDILLFYCYLSAFTTLRTSDTAIAFYTNLIINFSLLYLLNLLMIAILKKLLLRLIIFFSCIILSLILYYLNGLNFYFMETILFNDFGNIFYIFYSNIFFLKFIIPFSAIVYYFYS
jgi:hypothetical protein